MKSKVIATSFLAFAMCLGSVAYAFTGDYYPPERMNCGLNSARKLLCHGFDRQYLTEDTSDADFSGKQAAFIFTSASASKHAVTFKYKNSRGEVVKLKTISATIRPDLRTGHWRKVSDNDYNCDAGYMSCAITD